MAQFNQLISSASQIVIPPANFIAVLYDENYSTRMFDDQGEIFPTSSIPTYTASYAFQAEAFTSGSKSVTGSFIITEDLSVTGSAYVSKSLNVSGTISASLFSGSGADLYDISASSIVGLNLARISTSSFSASMYVKSAFVSYSYDTASAVTTSVNIPETGSFHINAQTFITGGLLANDIIGIVSGSGSFSGSGANLYDISASAIVGLNLSRISTGSYTASIDHTGSFKTNADVYVSSSTTPRNYNSTASIKTDGGMTVKNDAYFSSSVFIKGNLTILGTQSVEYVTSSHINFGDNILNLNTSDKNLRFGGIAVIDSGSTEAGNSGSFLWDSVNNQWIEDVTLNATRSSAAFIAGPLNTGSLGDEIGITQFSIPVGQGGNNITSSLITVSASVLTIPGTLSTKFSGSVSLTGSLILSNSVVSLQTSSIVINSSSLTINSGSIYVNNSYTGSNIFGTASWAQRVVEGGAVVTVSGSFPTGSNSANATGSATGSLWWNTEDGNLYIQVNSPTGSTWVPATNTVAASTYGATIRTDFASANTWSFAHGLNTSTPIVQVYTGSQVMVPSSIRVVDVNTLEILFAGNTAGSAVASTGVGGVTSASFAANSTIAVTASYLNGSTPTYVQASDLSVQSIPTATTTVLTGWTNQYTQSAGEWNNTTGVFTATKAGVYDVTAMITLGNAVWPEDTYVNGSIQKNGANYAFGYWVAIVAGTYVANTITVNAIVSLAVGDTLRVAAYQNSGNAVNLFTNGTFLKMTELPARLTR